MLPIDTKFTLGPEITEEQRAFLDHYGFLHFRGVATLEEVEVIRAEQDRLEQRWLEAGTTFINGIPLFFGKNAEGTKAIQRIPFTSRYSKPIENFVRDERFKALPSLVGEGARLGDLEKDGVVLNRYLNVKGSIYKRLGWHTDGLRDIFYGRMPQRMLNFGVHLDHCPRENGCLRLIPGSHTQSFWSTVFGKMHFISHGEDKNELCVETEPGDLTVHDGRLWHRVARSERSGKESMRRTMFVPYLTGPYEPKHEKSPTPGYHTLGRVMRNFNLLLAVLALILATATGISYAAVERDENGSATSISSPRPGPTDTNAIPQPSSSTMRSK